MVLNSIEIFLPFRKMVKTKTATFETTVPKISEPVASDVLERPDSGWNVQCRYLVAFWGFLCIFNLSAQRMNIGVAIVAMVNSTSEQQNNGSGHQEYLCPSDETITDETEKYVGEFQWSPSMQGYVLAAGHVGYMICQFPAGRLSEILGAKVLLVLGLLLASLCNVISPWTARWNVFSLIAAQLVKGVGLGVMTPSLSCFMANWFPREESSFLSSVMYSGIPLGCFAGALFSGLLCNTDFLDGWPLVFYVFGGFGCLSGLFVILFLIEDPKDHTSISQSELKYIISNQKKSLTERPKVPWTSIFSSLPCWAASLGMFGQFWANFYFISIHPTYMGVILNYSLKNNGLLSSTPFLLQAAFTWGASYMSNWLLKRNYVSLNFVRKGNNTASCLGFSICLIGIYFSGCDKTLNILCFVMAMGCIGFGFPGSVINPVDLAPTFAGTLMGITSTISASSGFVLPVVVGWFTNEEQSIRQWRKVFLTLIAISLASGIAFLSFGSADVQPWNSSEEAEGRRKSDDQKDGTEDDPHQRQIDCTTHL